MLSSIYGSTRTLLVIETTQGDRFGSFTSEPWRIKPAFFGTGESFLWRVNNLQPISEIEVFRYSGLDQFVQRCTNNHLWVGGGSWKTEKECPYYPSEPIGLGLTIHRDMQFGTSASCATFLNPCLSRRNKETRFEISNLEMWTVTPFYPANEAKRAEERKIFVEKHSRVANDD